MKGTEAKLFQESKFFIVFFYSSKVIIQVQNGNDVLNRLVPCMELAC